MSRLNSKSANIIKEVARELLCCKPGGRIPTVPCFTKKLAVGHGTIDRVLTTLKTDNIVKLQSRGQMGTYLLERDFIGLWNVADFGTLIGLLPLPNAREYEGLATAFTKIFFEYGIAFSLNFKNGGRERVQSLLNDRCEFTILSGSAAERVLKDYDDLELVMNFSNETFYSDFVVVQAKSLAADQSRWRIGVDRTSYDHIVLSEFEYPANEKVDVHYVNIPYLIADGRIDAAVCHNKSVIPFDLVEKISIGRVRQPASIQYLNKASAAAMVAKKEKREVLALLHEFCKKNRIEDIQREVIEGKRIPSY